MDLKGKKVTVVGLARSGVGAANLLSKMGAAVTVTDRKSKGELSDAVKRLAPSVMLALGSHPDKVFISADIIVISPGVLLEIKQILSATVKGVPVISELELAYQVIQGLGVRGRGLDKEISPIANPGLPIPFLAVTGSNGKSTTTALLNYMLERSGFKTFLGGNIGNALTEEIIKKLRTQNSKVRSKTENTELRTLASASRRRSQNFELPPIDYVVVEVSSFQLDAIDKFRPHIASILNITPDHLDRYHSMTEYINAKTKIFQNQQDTDYLVLNADDPETNEIRNKRFKARKLKPQVLFFSRQKAVKGIYYKNGIVYCNLPDISLPISHSPLIKADEIKIKGVHNLENAMAASAMALLANCPAVAVINALKEFEGLEHRMELVRELDGVKYINDSKGTNVGAVVKSIESFKEPLILIAGGRDKAGDFTLLRHLIKKKVKSLVLIGEAAKKISDAFSGVTNVVMAENLNEAVTASHDMAKKGDVVLLSPACASFDMFKDFEDRGRQFKKIVKEL